MTMNKKENFLRKKLKEEGLDIPLLFYHLKPAKVKSGKKVSRVPFSIDMLDTEKFIMRGFYKTISKPINVNNER